METAHFPFWKQDNSIFIQHFQRSRTRNAANIKQIGFSEVKSLLQVLDEEPLLDDTLMRLTRWMADYYLCAWGQVLNAVVPAGAKAQAGTRNVTFVEAIPLHELPNPDYELTPKQTTALRHLREIGEAVEMRQSTRLAQCGSGVIDGLVNKDGQATVLGI